jgi:hypothetical protein
MEGQTIPWSNEKKTKVQTLHRKPKWLFLIAAQFWKFTRQISNTFFIKMYTKSNEHAPYPQFYKVVLRPWSGISEVGTADSYGTSEFMSVRIVAQCSASYVFIIFCQSLNICLFVMLYLEIMSV